ncbi:MAG: MFS transporter [Christensenellaceae bacterium]|nr:MFS transporter [Christensenellaceae bacterium]
MKLNTKRTLLVGLAFLSISAFWQLYDNIVPLILRDSFRLGDDVAGVIMALDNVLALVLLPMFGALSDKCKSRFGRRMPFITVGTFAAAALALTIPFADKSKSLLLFFVALGLLLIAMGTYRSPAVALMPDVTPKPLRSKGNAIINLMGALGGIYTLIMIKLLAFPTYADGRTNYFFVFLAVAVLMVFCILALILTIRERKLVAEMQAINYGVPPEDDQVAAADETGKEKLPAPLKRSLWLILFSVSLWFMGYNAVTTAFTKYATQQWAQDVGGAATCLLVATAGAIVSYIPIGSLSSRIGRKKMILIGVATLATCFIVGGLFTAFHPVLYGLFLLVGFAWAAINVNSYPMVVEIAKGADVGKYTGYYYTFSMSAQIITPILSGVLLEHVGYWTLFPYAGLMVALAAITMSLTRHGDNRPQKPATRLEAFDVPDAD